MSVNAVGSVPNVAFDGQQALAATFAGHVQSFSQNDIEIHIHEDDAAEAPSGRVDFELDFAPTMPQQKSAHFVEYELDI